MGNDFESGQRITVNDPRVRYATPMTVTVTSATAARVHYAADDGFDHWEYAQRVRLLTPGRL